MSRPAGLGVELIADAGAQAASEEDLFRWPAFLAAEGTTHTLAIESPGRRTSIPLIVREIAGGGLDAVSPYAYPGGSVEGEGAPAEAALVDWRASGLISLFLRERLEPVLGGAESNSAVAIYDPGLPRRIRPRLAGQVRAAERDGWRVERIAGPRSSPADLEAFTAAYEQTMRRTGAAERYFFGREYYATALSFPGSWLLLARSARGEAGAAAIVALSDGHLHYFLGGTAESSLGSSPFKTVVVAMLDLADELDRPLNLGGGVRAGDGLERFKRGFANAERPSFVHRIVADPAAYERLSGDRATGGFFPAYRA